MNVLFDASAEQTRIMDEKPLQGSFGIENAKVIASGDPYHSVLLYRFCKLGPGHMPKLGGLEIDRRGAVLLHDWITSLGDNELEPSDQVGDTKLPDEQLVERLMGPSYSLATVHAIHTGQLGSEAVDRLLMLVPKLPPTSRDLFESFLPEDQRTERLGNDIDAEEILAKRGDVERGRSLFLSNSLSCKTCHAVEPGVKGVGANLTELDSKQYARELILENIMYPSKVIGEKYRTHVVQTSDGELLTGVAKTEDGVTILRDAQGKVHRIEDEDIEFSKVSDVSLMPEKMLAELTLEQARDLIEFVHSLR